MLESHGNISILLSEVHKLLRFSAKLTDFVLNARRRTHARQTDRPQLDRSAITIFLHIIYAYMVTFTLFICFIQIQNTEIYRNIPYTANRPKNTKILIFAHIASPTLKKRAFGNI